MAMRISVSSSNAALAPTLAGLALVCVVGTAAIWHATLGFAVISTEEGRRLAIERQPLAAPLVAIHAPQASTLPGLLAAERRVAIVNFIYSSCNAVCSAQGAAFQRLQEQIVQRGLHRRVRLLSISFDPRDTPAVLAAYARRQHADPQLWRMVSVDDGGDRQRLLDAFGVVVLPAPMDEFQHNAALHLIDQSGRLVRILDYDAPERALDQAALLANGGRP